MKNKRALMWALLFVCGPQRDRVRTDRVQLREMMREIENRVTENPLLFDQDISHKPLTSPKSPEHPGHVAIRRINWERREKRLKKDWYEKKAA